MASKKIRGTVAVQTAGRIYTASFIADGDTVTVTVPNGTFTTHRLGNLAESKAAEAALLELVREGRAG